jgi:hypothetical protein
MKSIVKAMERKRRGVDGVLDALQAYLSDLDLTSMNAINMTNS